MLPALFNNVITRLLRPLESNEHKILPSLVHVDLWYANVGIINPSNKEGIVFDPSSFWAYNEEVMSV
jgi:fructosamine-3-kinase